MRAILVRRCPPKPRREIVLRKIVHICTIGKANPYKLGHVLKFRKLVIMVSVFVVSTSNCLRPQEPMT